jgi:hypothetical protein
MQKTDLLMASNLTVSCEQLFRVKVGLLELAKQLGN